MTHDQQWQVIIAQLRDRFCSASYDDACSMVEYRAIMDMRLEAMEARLAGENPLLWKLANG